MYQSPPLSWEIFRNKRGALGKAADLVYGTIVTCGPSTMRQLASQLGYSDRRSIKAQIEKLAAHGLVAPVGTAERHAQLWGSGQRTPEQVAEALGLVDATEKQRARHVEEQLRFRVKTARTRGNARLTDDGSLIDETTGKVLVNIDGHYPSLCVSKAVIDLR